MHLSDFFEIYGLNVQLNDNEILIPHKFKSTKHDHQPIANTYINRAHLRDHQY